MGNRKKIVIILLAILVILLAAAGSYYIYSSIQKSEREKEELQQQIEDLKKKSDKDKGATETKKEPSTNETTTTTPCNSTITDSDKLMIETWKTYENSKYKYSFKYPETWEISDKQNDYLKLTDNEAQLTFEFRSDTMTALSPGEFKLDSSRNVEVACVKAKVDYMSWTDPAGVVYRSNAVQFTKNEIPHMVGISYKFIGASLSSDIVEAYDLILKTIEFK